MNRGQFDGVFSEMVRRLGAKVTKAQADLYFDEYGAGDLRDFAHACRELAMGNSGYMPKADVFRDYMAAAKEMRLHQESAHRDKLAQNLLHRGGVSQGPMDALFARCCARLTLGEPKDAAAFIEEALKNDAFRVWLESWTTEDRQVALSWLKAKIERKRTSHGVGLAMSA